MSFNKKTIKDIDLKGKRVLLRTMLNVPITDGKVTDSSRLLAAKPTIDYLLEQQASIVLISHHSHEGQSLEEIASSLEQVLGHEVRFVPESTGSVIEQKIKSLKPCDILMLENLRFDPNEEANDRQFARTLASYADVFVQDDFTTCHREHASIVGIPKCLPAVAGLQIELEVNTITRSLDAPKRPLVAVTGGAKVSTKIPIVSYLIDKVDVLFVGGAMANTFLLAQGISVGKSMVEPDQVETALKILKNAKAKGKPVLLPIDVVVASKLDPPENVRTVKTNDVGQQDIIVDLGPESVAQLSEEIKPGCTIIWNGPAGIFETPEFSKGTKALADLIIASGAYSLVGGGDTVDFIDHAGLNGKFGFVSTGGGASLELMSGKKLPGVEALLDK